MIKTIVNADVPEFAMEAYVDGKNEQISKESTLESWAMYLFYTADFTEEDKELLGSVANAYDEFIALGAKVYAVSTDTVYAHKAWHDSDEEIAKVKFPMLSDKTGYLCTAFGVLNPDTFMAYRGVFLVDPQGQVKASEVSDSGIRFNIEELLRKLKEAMDAK